MNADAESLLVQQTASGGLLLTMHFPLGQGQYLTLAVNRPKSDASLDDIRETLLVEAQHLLAGLLGHPAADKLA